MSIWAELQSFDATGHSAQPGSVQAPAPAQLVAAASPEKSSRKFLHLNRQACQQMRNTSSREVQKNTRLHATYSSSFLIKVQTEHEHYCPHLQIFSEKPNLKTEKLSWPETSHASEKKLQTDPQQKTEHWITPLFYAMCMSRAVHLVLFFYVDSKPNLFSLIFTGNCISGTNTSESHILLCYSCKCDYRVLDVWRVLPGQLKWPRLKSWLKEESCAWGSGLHWEQGSRIQQDPRPQILRNGQGW